jgi:thiamine biosynthesis lipoprotein
MTSLPPLQALGTSWWLELFDDVPPETRQHAHSVLAGFLTQFEARYSRFRPDSWLSRLNHERRWSNPDPEFVALLTYSLQAYTRSNGIFNLLIGNELIARGYDRNYRFTPSKPPPPPPDPHTILSLEPDRITLRDNWTIDVGGYGKGYAIDAATQLLKASGYHHFLLNGGGDMYVTSNQGQPVVIHLEHPTDPGLSLGTIALQETGFAASSPFKRQWQVDGKTFSHLMPTPTTVGAVATFVIAPTARDADMFATATALLPEADCATLARREHLRVARYTPASSTWWSINWPTTPHPHQQSY